MTKEEILARIIECLSVDFEIPKSKITLDSNLYSELDLDSIDAVDLIVKLQELTKKKIMPTDFKEVHTVGNLVDKVYEMLQQ